MQCCTHAAAGLDTYTSVLVTYDSASDTHEAVLDTLGCVWSHMIQCQTHTMQCWTDVDVFSGVVSGGHPGLLRADRGGSINRRGSGSALFHKL